MLTVSPALGMTIFGLLVLLLVQKEVLRAMGRAIPRTWQITANYLIGALLLVYGGVLIARFLSLL